MNRPTGLVQILSLAAFAIVASLGCNGLLGNEEGTPRPAEAGVATVDAGDASGGGQLCDVTQGNKVCFGLCVKIDSPNTGCGGPSCDACDPKNVGATACKGSAGTLTCGFDTCKPGFDNCDGDATNGCETSLGGKDTCGSCTTKCPTATPLCAASSGVYGCVASCPTGTQDCTGSCVDTSTSTENCGGCGVKCARVSATATCTNGTCNYACAAGTHECGNVCASDIDPNSCGMGCMMCSPAGPNATPTCSAGMCGTACAKGFLDCDGNPANGCEYAGAICPVTTFCKNVVCLKTEQCCKDKCIPAGQLC